MQGSSTSTAVKCFIHFLPKKKTTTTTKRSTFKCEGAMGSDLVPQYRWILALYLKALEICKWLFSLNIYVKPTVNTNFYMSSTDNWQHYRQFKYAIELNRESKHARLVILSKVFVLLLKQISFNQNISEITFR